MFNLEQAIIEWRKQMLNAGIKTPVPLDELESHLREDIDKQMRSGLDAQRAFDIAVQRIGQAAPLKREFAKVGQVMSAQEHKLTWILCTVCIVLDILIGVFVLFVPLPDPSAFPEQLVG